MAIENGIYKFSNSQYPGMLNLYYDGSVSNGQNVVLWSSDNSLEQQWRYDGNRLLSMRNQNFALDRYAGSGTNQNNADVWEADDNYSDDQFVDITYVATNRVVIKLRSDGRVLTAVNGETASASGKTPTSNGNVYWAEYTGTYRGEQVWYITRVDEAIPSGVLTLAQLQAKFPCGKYWNHVGMRGNNQDGYTDTPCPTHENENIDTCNAFEINGAPYSWQCMGFAEKCGYDTTGYNPRSNGNWVTSTSPSSLNNLKAGDIVRYWIGSNMHSIFVTAVNGDTVTYGDCNGTSAKCRIRWDAEIDKQTLRSNFVHTRIAPQELSI